MKKPSKKKWILVFVCIVLIAAVAAGAWCFAGESKKLDMGDYVRSEVTLSGYDGYGTISALQAVDVFTLVYDLNDLSIPEEVFVEEYQAQLGFDPATDYVGDYIEVSFDKSDYLSNGDTVHAEIRVNYGLINDMGYAKTLYGEEVYNVSYRISGLEVADVFDPFELINTVYYDRQYDNTYITLDNSYTKTVGDYTATSSGDEYYANLVISDADGNAVAEVYYYTDPSSFETDGTIRVDVSCKETQFADDYGFVITPISKEYEPSVLSYLSEAVLTEADYNAIKEAADAYMDDQYDGAEFVKAYFGYNGEESYDVNSLIFVYTRDEFWDDITVYTALRYDNVKIDEGSGSINELGKMHLYTGYYSYNYARELITAMNGDYSSIAVLRMK